MSKIVLPPRLQEVAAFYLKNKKNLQQGFLAFAVASMAFRIRSIASSKHFKLKRRKDLGSSESNFMSKFIRILKIIIPGIVSKEFWLLSLFSGFLVLIALIR